MMDSKLLKELHNDDRESQLFDISSDAIAISVLNGIQYQIDSEVNKLRASLLNKAKGKDSAGIAINKACSELRTRYMTTAISYVDQIRSIFKEHMNVPPHTLLPGEVKPKKPLTDEEMDKLDSKVKELYARYNRAMCMEKFLKAEKANLSLTVSLEKSLLVAKSLHSRVKLTGQEIQRGKSAVKIIAKATERMDDPEVSELRKNATPLDLIHDAEEESSTGRVLEYKERHNLQGELDPFQMLDILEKIKLEEQLESQEISDLVENMDTCRKSASHNLAQCSNENLARKENLVSQGKWDSEGKLNGKGNPISN